MSRWYGQKVGGQLGAYSRTDKLLIPNPDSISRYMLSNGAHNFTFIGRSGTDKEAARLVVEDLREYGANVDVVRGDVQDISTVTDALDRMQMPLGGVIQAAMGLGVSIPFSIHHLAQLT